MADEELVGLEGVSDDTGVQPESFDATPEPQGEVEETAVDPRDARLDKIEALLAEIDPIVREARGVKATVGRIQSVEASLKRLSESNPLADIDPRVSVTEDVTVTLARVLANSPLVDDADRASIQASLRAVEQAKTARERKQMMSELKAELSTADVSAPQPDPIATLWEVASAEVREMASEYGVALTSIPWDDIQRDANNNPARVARVALKWFEANKPDPVTERVAERRRAAGSGSPAREGAGNILESDKTRLMESGIPITDEAARKRVAESLGLEI